MRHFLVSTALLATLVIPAGAQAVDATACDIAGHPARYNGKIVRIKAAVVQVGFDSFLIRGTSCSSPVWLSYPAGTKAKAGPAAVLTLQLAANATVAPSPARPPVPLERNKDFDTFDSLLSQKVKTPGMCLACVKNDVTATLVGRVDGTDDPGLQKDAAGKITKLDGFGNMDRYGARLVLQSVSEVQAMPIDFSKAPTVKDDNQGANGKDYIGATTKTVASFPKGSDAGAQVERAVAALGAPGVDNGVNVAFDPTDEVPAGEGLKGAKPSPDGLLLTIHIDSDKLKGDALSRAIAHEGAEVASLRDNAPGGNLATQMNAWQAALYVTIGARQKSLTLPGGTVIWSEAWPVADRTANAGAGLDAYLTDREQTPR